MALCHAYFDIAAHILCTTCRHTTRKGTHSSCANYLCLARIDDTIFPIVTSGPFTVVGVARGPFPFLLRKSSFPA